MDSSMHHAKSVKQYRIQKTKVHSVEFSSSNGSSLGRDSASFVPIDSISHIMQKSSRMVKKSRYLTQTTQNKPEIDSNIETKLVQVDLEKPNLRSTKAKNPKRSNILIYDSIASAKSKSKSKSKPKLKQKMGFEDKVQSIRKDYDRYKAKYLTKQSCHKPKLSSRVDRDHKGNQYSASGYTSSKSRNNSIHQNAVNLFD